MEQVVLAQRGHDGYRQYRIPAMAVTPSGRIITIYDARFDFDDLPAPIDLVIRSSDDNGLTWSKQEVFRKHDGVCGYGDASILIDPSVGQQGRIVVLYQYTQHAGFFESSLGTDPNDPEVAQIGASYSDDDGVTWQHKFITNQLKTDLTPGIFATSGMGARIAFGDFAGRLLQGFVLRTNSELLSAIGYSDDHGDSWSLGALIPGGNETAIAALNDGSILVHSRGTPFRLGGRSVDGGLTLTEISPDITLPDPSDNGSVVTLSNGSLICTHNHDSDLRMNTVIKYSDDNGMTWSKASVLEQGSSAYSTACELGDGSIGILFERNAYVEIVFARIFPQELKPIELLNQNQDGEEIEFTVVPRFIRPARKDLRNFLKHKPPLVPEVDMSTWRLSERKEVGNAGGSTSGEVLLTKLDLDQLLGEITPGLHVGDEIRISGKLHNKSELTLPVVKISDESGTPIASCDQVGPQEKLRFLDFRQVVTSDDLLRGYVSLQLKWSSNGVTKDRKRIDLSTVDGLPLITNS